MYFVAILLHKQANQYLLILPELLDTPGKQTPGKYSLGRGENYSLLHGIYFKPKITFIALKMTLFMNGINVSQ